MKKEITTLRIPRDDKIVSSFLDAQVNKQVSLRILIRDFVRKYGFSDVMLTDTEGFCTKSDAKKVSIQNKSKIKEDKIKVSDNSLSNDQVENRSVKPDVLKPEMIGNASESENLSTGQDLKYVSKASDKPVLVDIKPNNHFKSDVDYEVESGVDPDNMF